MQNSCSNYSTCECTTRFLSCFSSAVFHPHENDDEALQEQVESERLFRLSHQVGGEHVRRAGCITNSRRSREFGRKQHRVESRLNTGDVLYWIS